MFEYVTYKQYMDRFGVDTCPDVCPDCSYGPEIGDHCSDVYCGGGLYVPKVSEIHSGVPQDSAWQPEELEVDAKKADITKAKPGQMMEDFNLALLAVSEVTRYGVEKYNRPGSWKHAHKDLMKYKDAAARHLLKQPTEMYDDESGYLHIIQVIWNYLALLQMMLEFDKVKPRDLTKITKPVLGTTRVEPLWFKEESNDSE